MKPPTSICLVEAALAVILYKGYFHAKSSWMRTGASTCQRRVAPYMTIPGTLSNIQWPRMLNSAASTYQRVIVPYWNSELTNLYCYSLPFVTRCIWYCHMLIISNLFYLIYLSHLGLLIFIFTCDLFS